MKSRKSRNTWSNRQIWPWSTEWGRAKVNRVLPRERNDHNKHPLPTTQDKTTHGHHQMVNTEISLIIFFAAKDGEALYSQQKQDRELTVAQIMNSLLPNSDLNWRKWGKPLDHSNHCPNQKCFLHQNTKQLDKENLSAPEKSKFSPHHNCNITIHIYMGRNFKSQTV